MQEIVVEKESERIDTFLKKRYLERSRSYFQYLIENNYVLLNNKKTKKNVILKKDDIIKITFKETPPIALKPQNIPLNIIYEDDHIICVNKESNQVTHPAVGHPDNTFVNALLYHCNSLPYQDSLRPGIVHRLDKDTSGLIIAAKTKKAHNGLLEIFAKREIEKKYLAITVKNPKNITLKAPIKRHPINRKTHMVAQDGKMAISSFKTLSSKNDFSLVLVTIETGRTHQIRIHLKHLLSPVLGDDTYGNKKINKQLKTKRQLLHSYFLKFIHPITKKTISLQAPLPIDFINYIDKLNLEKNILD